MRTVIGFHACCFAYAQAVCSGEISLTEWRMSRNRYDWLGDGIYFWENGQRRAEEWAREFVEPPAAIVRAEIDLRRCLDLSETSYLAVIRGVYEDLATSYRKRGLKLPENREVRRSDRRNTKAIKHLDALNVKLYRWLAGIEFERKAEKKLRYLDSLVINQFLSATEQVGRGFQTVRCPFEEGEPLFPGSMIRVQSHVQISVRDVACIRDVSLVPLV